MATKAGQTISIREELKGKPSLDDRIADAFSSALASADLAELLAEVERTNEAAKAESKEAEARALNPKVRSAEVAEARRLMEDANFRSKRMDAAAEQLKGLLSSTRSREEAEVRRIAHEAAIAERDQLVTDLAAYEGHAAAIVDLLQRIEANNQKLHMDEQAERIARGEDLHWNVKHDDVLPKLLTLTRLPKFKRDGTLHGYLWPQRS